MFTAAFRTYGRSWLGIAAVMAAQIIGFLMVSKGNITFGTTCDITTGPAHHKGGEPPSVQEQYGLFPAFHSCNNALMQITAEHRPVPILQLLTHIYDPNHRQFTSCWPHLHFKQNRSEVVACLRPCRMVAFERRSRGSKDYHSFVLSSPSYSHIPCMILGRLLLLIGCFMLFVHDNKT
ncbi:hypothetical protein D3C81_1551740 [compost metagenome]